MREIRPSSLEGGTTFDSSFLPLSFKDVVVTAQEEIALNISHAAGGLRLSWPATPSGFVLQHATRLLPAQWSNHPEPPGTEGNEKVLLIPTGDDYRFFRLLKVN